MVRSCLGNSPPPPWPSQPVVEDPAHGAGAFVVRATTAALKTGRGPLAFTTDRELRASLGVSEDTHWRWWSHGVPKGSTALACAQMQYQLHRVNGGQPGPPRRVWEVHGHQVLSCSSKWRMLWGTGCRHTGLSSCSVWTQHPWHTGLVVPRQSGIFLDQVSRGSS